MELAVVSPILDRYIFQKMEEELNDYLRLMNQHENHSVCLRCLRCIENALLYCHFVLNCMYSEIFIFINMLFDYYKNYVSLYDKISTLCFMW